MAEVGNRAQRILMANCRIIFLACCCCLLLISSAQPPSFLQVEEKLPLHANSGEHILQTQSTRPTFACGFHGNETTSYYFSVFIYPEETLDIQVVWTANRDKPLSDSSMTILGLSQEGNLELVDGHGRVIWSAGAAGKPIAAMKLEESGNLVLLDAKNVTVWQSFDHPTDTLVARQQLKEEQRLTSFYNSTKPLYYVTTKDGDLSAFIDGEPPLMYLQLKDFSKTELQCSKNGTSTSGTYSRARKLDCGETQTLFLFTFALYGNSHKTVRKSANHFIKLEPDGKLKVYDFDTNGNEWVFSELGNPYSDQCLYPLTCGHYGVCQAGQCSCPATPDRKTHYFTQVNDVLPNQGCHEAEAAPFCSEHEARSLEYFGNYSYFAYVDASAAEDNIIKLEACREACLNNCSCKAVFFNSQSNNTNGSGNCYLLHQVFSIRTEPLYNRTYISQAFFKVSRLSIPQTQAPSESKGVGGLDKKDKNAKSIIGIAVASLAVAVFAAGTVVFLIRRKREAEEDEEEDELDQVHGMMPRRFPYEELKTATEDFQTTLGQGGFGSVFRGVLNDGIQVAVKRLDNKGQGTKEFVAEVQTIGSIHHMNLVRLVGFCAKKSHRLLVYEYMPNGSLDKWIFHENDNPNLDWKTRMNIIIGMAKGLCYLHEECRHRIAHLDIKPQNILLDENFNAKISDFGLSKLISRDESQVFTTMRGTPGYLAPEWLSAAISEKADVYSFGVVVTEIVCGRKNLDLSQPEERRQLLKLLQPLAQENQLLDLVDMVKEEKSHYGEEAVKVMRIAIWCLQDDHTQRPPMSLVVKALEGTMELDSHMNIDLGLVSTMEPQTGTETQSGSQSQETKDQSFFLSGPM